MASLIGFLNGGARSEAWVALLVDCAVKGALILALAGASAAMLRRAQAAARHFIWTLAIVGLALLPVLTVIAPSWRAPVLPLAAANSAETAPSPEPLRVPRFTVEIDPGRIAPARAEVQRVPSRANLQAPGAIVLLWATGVVVVGGQLLVSLIAIRRRGKHAAAINDGVWTLLLAEIARQYGIRRPVSLLVASGTTIPATWGLRRPVILLPIEAVDWPPDRLRAVLLHELAHVARGDFLVQTLARIVCAAGSQITLAEAYRKLSTITPRDYRRLTIDTFLAMLRGVEYTIVDFKDPRAPILRLPVSNGKNPHIQVQTDQSPLRDKTNPKSIPLFSTKGIFGGHAAIVSR